VHATLFDLGNREKKIEVSHPDGRKEATNLHYNRTGEERLRETVKMDANGREVAKTVVAKNNLTIRNTTIINNTRVVNNVTEYHREYVRARYGFVYTPVTVVRPAFYAAWYDPYWYAPAVVVGGAPLMVTTHPFVFSWGWADDPWYVYHRAYWEPYPVYVAPSYWVTDWMVADYLADRYATIDSAEQSRKEADLAREDAEKAKAAASQARDEAEIAEARATAAEAELRATRSEARAKRAEAAEASHKEVASNQNPNAHPLDQATKDALNSQIAQTIVENKQFAEQKAGGANPPLPDLSRALADPNHIYPVSKKLPVTSASDTSPAGNLTPGDLLKLDPGQEAQLKDATENTVLVMRVMTSNGDDDEVAAGARVNVRVKDLQDFDSEFRAKLDAGLQLASQNMDQFKSGQQQAQQPAAPQTVAQ
jgi:hypothetical protein